MRRKTGGKTREIKFRAWDKEDKVMYCNIEMGIKFDDNSEYTFGDFLNNRGYHNYKIMQYTGLKDKNRKEIYEGDIVHGICDIYFQGEKECGNFFIAWDCRKEDGN